MAYDLMIGDAALQATMERVGQEVLKRLRAARNPAEVRAAIALSDITGAGVQAPESPTWWPLVSEPILDTLIEKEIAEIYVEPVQPGGRRVNLLSWDRTSLRVTGTDHAGVKPSLSGKDLVPKNMHSYVKIDEAALMAMMYRFSRQAFLRDRDAALLAENALFVRSWVYSVLGSLVNLWWNGDTAGGVSGLDIFDGWLKQVKTGGHADTTAGTDLLGTVFPNMWANASLDQRHLDMPDIRIYTSRLMAQKYKAQVLSNTLDVRGSYDKSTGDLYFLNAKIVPVTDFPTTNNGSNVLALLTRRINLVAGIVDKPLQIDHDFALAGRFHEFSSPVASNCVIADTDVCVYWMPPA